MTQCNSCRLYYDEVDKSGRCESCAGERKGMADDQQLAALQQQVSKLENVIQQVGGAPAAVDPKQAINQAFWTAPADAAYTLARRAAQEEIGQRNAAQFETLREVARDQARQKDAELFDRFADKIDAHMASLPPDFQINRQYWQAAMERMIGAHFKEIQREQAEAARAGKPAAPALHGLSDGPAAVGARPSPASTPSTSELSPDAHRVMRMLRLNEEQMKRGIEAFANQGDAMDPTKPSSWDRVMSFDDQTGPRARALAARKAVTA